MPKRNLVLLCLLSLACLVAWAARRSVGAARLYGEVTGHVRRAYIEPVGSDALFHAAMEGVFARLDGQSGIVSVSDVGEAEGTTASDFAGVGLELSIDGAEGVPLVTTPMVGSPAWLGGIATGDRIVAIDGVRTRGMRLKEAVGALRGPAGSRVVVDVVGPAGQTPEIRDERGDLVAARSVSLERAVVRQETVLGDRRRADGSWDWFVEGEEGVALVRLARFDAATAAELDRACAEIAAVAAPRGIVLDLRGNRGGSVAAAVEVCDRFLDDGVIVATRRRAGRTDAVESRRATPGAVFSGVPMVVLVDGWTASAAEIVAACLQDRSRAVVAGTRSFGKGTVQTTVPLSDGRQALRLTTSEYLRPSLAPLHRHADAGDADPWGVSPDAGMELAPTGETLEAIRAWRAGRDSIPRHAAAVDAEGSAARLPRHVDPVLGRALVAIPASSAGR